METVIHSYPTRQSWVDIAKGLGILWVMVAHLPIPAAIFIVLHSFNMPCFFFLSGLLFSSKRPFLNFTCHKAQTLLKPYLVFSVLSYGIWVFIRPFSNTAKGYDVFHTLLAIGYGTNMPGYYLAHNMPLWFLPCLFMASVLFYGISRLSAPYRWLVAGVSVLIGCHWLDVLPVRPPGSLDVAMVAVLFMQLGYWARTFYRDTKPLPVWVLIVMAGLNVYCCLLNPLRPDMNLNVYGNFGLFLVAAVSGLLCLTNIAKYLAHTTFGRRVLAKIGRNSLYILGFHGLSYLILNGVLAHVVPWMHIVNFVWNLHGSAGWLQAGEQTLAILLYVALGLFFSQVAKRLLSPVLNN